MNLVRVAARALTGTTYAILGWDAAVNPGPRVDMAAGTLATIRKAVPLPQDDELIVRGNGAAQAVGGALLAVGVFPRPAAAVLAASLLPTTLAGHAYWTIEDPAARKAQRTQFLKNLAMLGGLAFAYNDSRR